MTEVQMSSEITVELRQVCATDLMVVDAARVSTGGEYVRDPGGEVGLINYLMKSRHGSPFEHNMFTFYIEAPLFVFREWQRHRISSFNEMSGRYTEMLPKFYSADRFRRNTGSSARPEMEFVAATHEDSKDMRSIDLLMANWAWESYQGRLARGMANELARTVLPLSIYSKMYWTVNARSLMNFLSLRVDSPNAAVRTRPQLEIQMGAEQVEDHFREAMPVTWDAFVKNGRVAP